MPGLGCLHFAANVAESRERMSKNLRFEISRSCFNKPVESTTGFLLSVQTATKKNKFHCPGDVTAPLSSQWLTSDSLMS